MRHAKQSGLAARDHERPLTDKGKDDAYRVGVRLASDAPLPIEVLSSTALRCRETWNAVAAGMGSSLLPDFEPTLYNASSKDLLHAITGVGDEVDSLLVLAHNPGISVLAHHLASADPESALRLESGFTPASTARFDVEGAWSTLSPSTARLRQFDRE